ncbi:MAG TPA: TonB-dependent receptor, partial [Vicinamibacterales bacterium]
MLATWLLIALTAGQLQQQPVTAGELALQGRTLTDALHIVTARGLRIVFSPDVVRPEMRVRVEPHGTTLRAIVDEILEPHGLAVRVEADGSLTVIKTPRFQETVDVAGATAGTGAPPPLAVPAIQVDATAGGVENVFHTLQLLPGVTAVSEFSSRQSVRGGGPDENMIVMDQIELLNPYRLFGVISGINPETVDRFELFAGAFPAAYGDRLSSLLVVDTRDGTAARALQASADVSITDANIVLEGRLPGGRRGSWLVTGRRTYYDLIAGRLSTDIRHFPGFTDGQLKLVWEPAPPWKLTVHALTSHERADVTPDQSSGESGLTGSAAASTQTVLAAVTLERTVGPRAHYRGTVSLSQLNDAFAFQAGDCLGTQVVNMPGGSAVCDAAPSVHHSVNVSDAALRQQITWRVGDRQVADAGLEAHAGQSRLSLGAENANFPALTLPGFGMFAVGRVAWHTDPEPLDSAVSENKAALWLEDRVAVTPALTIVPGARLDHVSATGETLASPRLSSSFTVGKTTLTAAAGLHYQSPGYDKAFLGGAAFGLNLSAPGAALRSERAIQTVAGVERNVGGGFSLRVEGYDRRLDRLIIGRLETEQERASRVASYSSAWAALGVAGDIPTAALITNIPSNGGSGRAAGVELLISKHPSGTSRYSGWLSYTLAKADREAYGITYPFDYDRRHTLAVAGEFQANRRVTLSTSVQAASGLPVTLPIGAAVSAR